MKNLLIVMLTIILIPVAGLACEIHSTIIPSSIESVMISLEPVIITIQPEAETIPCPEPERSVVKRADGTYHYLPFVSFTLEVCYGPLPPPHKEVWTDFPEKGGKFIRIVD